MNPLPGATQLRDVQVQHLLNAPELPKREAVIFPEPYWSSRTVEVEHGLMLGTNDMHMRRTMIVWVNDDSEILEPQDRRQHEIVART